jgi:hypothetical protein
MIAEGNQTMPNVRIRNNHTLTNAEYRQYIRKGQHNWWLVSLQTRSSVLALGRCHRGDEPIDVTMSLAAGRYFLGVGPARTGIRAPSWDVPELPNLSPERADTFDPVRENIAWDVTGDRWIFLTMDLDLPTRQNLETALDWEMEQGHAWASDLAVDLALSWPSTGTA